MTVIDIFLLVLNKYFLSCLCCRNKLVQQVDPVVAENQLSDCKYNINKKNFQPFLFPHFCNKETIMKTKRSNFSTSLFESVGYGFAPMESISQSRIPKDQTSD